MKKKKSKVVASSVLLASLASSFSGSLSAFAANASKTSIVERVKSIGRNTKKWLSETKNKLKVVGTAAVVGTVGYLSNKYVYVKKIPTIRDSEGLIDIASTARYASQMYWADPDKFEDRIRKEDFFKLYDAYQYGYIPFTSIFGVNEQQEKDFKDKLRYELKRKIELGEPVLYLKSKLIGSCADDFVAQAPDFLKACINRDPKKDPIVGIFCVADGGIGKDYAAKLLNKYVSGNDSLNDLPLTNAGKEQVDTMITGVTKSYKGSDEPPVLESFQQGNKFTTFTLFGEFEKMDPKNVGSLLGPMQEGNAPNKSKGEKYTIKTDIIATSNLGAKDHKFQEGWDMLWQNNIDKIKEKYLEDMVKYGGQPMRSRFQFVAVFKEPLYEDRLDMVQFYLNNTKGSKFNPNFYVDPDLRKEDRQKLLGKLLERLGGKDSPRDISNKIVMEASKLVGEQHKYAGVLDGRKVQLSLDASGNIVTTIL